MGQPASKSVTPQQGSGQPVAITPAVGDKVMRAWLVPKADSDLTKLTIHTIPVPEPGPTQIRVQIVCASVNPVDVLRVGTASCAFPAVIGTDGSGVVDKVGDEAKSKEAGISVGDEVFFHVDTTGGQGTLGEYTIVELDTVARMSSATAQPTTSDAKNKLTFAEAATLPSAGWTAYIAMFDKLKVEKDRVIFIDGAAGGVGSYAIQFAKMIGLYVIASCSTYNVEYLKKLGVDSVIDYVMDDVSDKLRDITEGRGVDYMLELVSPEQATRYAHHIRFGGALCQVGGALRSLETVFFHNQISLHHVNLNGLHKTAATAPLLGYLGRQCVSMVESGTLKPCHYEVVAFEQIRDVLIMLSKGHAKGKVVVRVIATKREKKP